MTLKILQEIQDEVLQLLLKDNVLQIEECQCPQGVDRFHGFVVKKKFTAGGEISFPLKKLRTVCYCCKKESSTKYVSSLHLNNTQSLVWVILNKTSILKDVLKETVIEVAGVGESRENMETGYAFVIHSANTVNHIGTYRSLLLSLALRRILHHVKRLPVDVYCYEHGSSTSPCKLIQYSDEAINIANPKSLIEGDNVVDFSDSNILMSVEDIKLSSYCYEKSEDPGCTFVDGREYLESSKENENVYCQEIKCIKVLQDGKSTQPLKHATKLKKIFHGGLSQRLLHFVPVKKMHAFQQGLLVLEILEKQFREQKFFSVVEDVDISQNLTFIDEWLRFRQDELWRSYRMKYGKNISGPEWESTVNRVAVASIKLDIYSSAKNAKLCPGKEDLSRNSLFILYNYARLCMVKQHYDEKVQQELYPKLPDITGVDFSLLTDVVEYELVVRYIMFFPKLLEDSCDMLTNDTSRKVQISINQIYDFLSSMCRSMSSYYHQTKILLEGRPHLLPLMFARLHLALALKKIMEHSFEILGVDAPHSM